jgi:hypothetical protein
MKQASVSSTDQGGGKRRDSGVVVATPHCADGLDTCALFCPPVLVLIILNRCKRRTKFAFSDLTLHQALPVFFVKSRYASPEIHGSFSPGLGGVVGAVIVVHAVAGYPRRSQLTDASLVRQVSFRSTCF